jgi:hypothetical protein
MFLSVHTCAGAVIGRFSPNPIVAFCLGFLSHFLLDAIPHGDLKVYDSYRSGKILRRMVAIFFLDGIFSIYTATLVLMGNNRFGDEMCIAAGIFGSVLPDLFVMFYEITKIKILKKFHVLHFKVHRLIAGKREVPYIFGIAYQVIAMFFLLTYVQIF